jgi:hypothetical protein
MAQGGGGLDIADLFAAANRSEYLCARSQVANW